MRKNTFLYCTLLILFSSCKSLQRLSAKDNSAPAPTAQTNNGNHVVFLDNIEVTPGPKSTAVNTSTGSTSKKNSTTSKPVQPAAKTNVADAGSLQSKYAPMLNATNDQTFNVNLLRDIDHWWGTRYCMGGSTGNCTDCSAFTQNIMRDVYGASLPRTAQQQYDSTERVDDAEIKEGDLVFFHTAGRTGDITHVGVYVANNKFVHASTSAGVTISDLNDTYWFPKFRGAGRVRKVGE